ncbi:hypothetical protein UPYG_G00223210 [Umbra pygmaea]|uniref:Uncharacterized protein n=1 Tax=Umbra pygmaea TaxID=75934 RepID=A0ABD0WBY4_UMBPY
MERWPALFQINAEFVQLMTVPLESRFMTHPDRQNQSRSNQNQRLWTSIYSESVLSSHASSTWRRMRQALSKSIWTEDTTVFGSNRLY